MNSILPKIKSQDLGTGKSTDTAFMKLLFSGDESRSGVKVSPETALTLSAFYNAVHIKSGIIASLPLKKYRKSNEGRDEVTDGVTRLVQFRANNIMTAHQWRRLQEQSVMFYGYSISVVFRNRRGEASEIRWIHPNKIQIKLLKEYVLSYRIKINGQWRVFDHTDVIHVNSTVLQDHGLLGKSCIEAGTDNLGLGIAAERNASSFFKNGSMLSGVLKREGHFPDAEKRNRFLESWQSTYSGSNNSGKTALLEDGVEFESLAVTPKDAQLLEVRGVTIEDVARWTDIPPFLLKTTKDSSYNNIASFDLAFVKYSITPQILKPLEQELWSKLLSVKERANGTYWEHNVDGVLRGDPKTTAEIAQILVNSGIWAKNEVRTKLYNLNGVPGGDEPYTPQNITGGSSGE